MGDKFYINTAKKEKHNVILTVRIENIYSKKTSTDKTYYEIFMRDKTGTSKTNIFNEDIDFKIGDVLNCEALYDNKWSNFKILSYKILKEDEYEESEIENIVKADIDEILENINIKIEEIENIFIKNIINKFYKDEKIINQIKKLPDSIYNNQKSEGGSLEKHWNILENSLSLFDSYSKNTNVKLNKDIIIGGSLLLSISKYLEFKITEENKILYTDIGSLIESSKLSLFKVMEIGKSLIMEDLNKQEDIEKTIKESEEKIEEIKIFISSMEEENVEETINKNYEIESFNNNIKNFKEEKEKLKKDSIDNNLLLLKLNHIVSTQNYYFNEKENTSSYPKFIEAQIVSMAVFNNYKLSVFIQEFNNISDIESEENSIYSNKLNKFLFNK